MKLINKTLVLSLLVGVSACRDTQPKAEVEQSSSEKLTNAVDENVKEKVTKETKKIVKPLSQVNFKGRSYPIYTRRIEPASGLSENEIAIHEAQESMRLIYAEARSVGMSNMHNYNIMLKNRASELKELQNTVNRLKKSRKKPSRRSNSKQNKVDKK